MSKKKRSAPERAQREAIASGADQTLAAQVARLVEQAPHLHSRRWTTREGQTVRVADMSPSHAARARAMLLRDLGTWVFLDEVRALSAMFPDDAHWDASPPRCAAVLLDHTRLGRALREKIDGAGRPGFVADEALVEHGALAAFAADWDIPAERARKQFAALTGEVRESYLARSRTILEATGRFIEQAALGSVETVTPDPVSPRPEQAVDTAHVQEWVDHLLGLVPRWGRKVWQGAPVNTMTAEQAAEALSRLRGDLLGRMDAWDMPDGTGGDVEEAEVEAVLAALPLGRALLRRVRRG